MPTETPFRRAQGFTAPAARRLLRLFRFRISARSFCESTDSASPNPPGNARSAQRHAARRRAPLRRDRLCASADISRHQRGDLRSHASSSCGQSRRSSRRTKSFAVSFGVRSDRGVADDSQSITQASASSARRSCSPRAAVAVRKCSATLAAVRRSARARRLRDRTR